MVVLIMLISVGRLSPLWVAPFPWQGVLVKGMKVGKKSKNKTV